MTLSHKSPTYVFWQDFFYQRRLLKIQMVGELYCQTMNDRTNKVITINWIHSSKSTKGFYNFQGKFWILKIWIGRYNDESSKSVTIWLSKSIFYLNVLGSSLIWTCRISNICCCFLQASAVEKIKTNIRNSTHPNRCATKDKRIIWKF